MTFRDFMEWGVVNHVMTAIEWGLLALALGLHLSMWTVAVIAFWTALTTLLSLDVIARGARR